MSRNSPKADHVMRIISSVLTEDKGFETHFFRIGDYNDAVSDVFKLPYDRNAVGVLVLSTPNMFDLGFRQWIEDRVLELGSLEEVSEDYPSPIQSFLEDQFGSVSERLDEFEHPFDIIYDHSFTPQRRPRILMQTCGHIAGAAYYYQPQHYADESWPSQDTLAEHMMDLLFGPNAKPSSAKKFIGLSLHPVYGGHFAFRSAIIFPDILVPGFEKKEPISILSSTEEVRVALDKFNYSWKDSNFRDFGAPKKRYSPIQMEFFGRPVMDRWEVLRQWTDELESTREETK